MTWIEKIDKYTLLGLKKIRGYSVIMPIFEKHQCRYWAKGQSKEKRQLILGQPDSIAYMQRKSVNRFVVGSFGTPEIEYFYLLKGQDQVWHAYRDDSTHMFRILDIHQLNFDLFDRLNHEFKQYR